MTLERKANELVTQYMIRRLREEFPEFEKYRDQQRNADQFIADFFSYLHREISKGG